MHGAWILAGLYIVIMVESATVGILFHATLIEIVEHKSTDLSKRDSNNVLILTFVIVALIGHLLTLPCLCFAVQTHRAAALVPYLVWRMLLSAIILVIVIWQVVLGAAFFAIAMRAHREFAARRLLREHTRLPSTRRLSAECDAIYNYNNNEN